MIYRGDIPCFGNLLPRDRGLFMEEIELPEDAEQRKARLKEIEQELTDLDLHTPRFVSLATTTTPDKLSARCTMPVFVLPTDAGFKCVKTCIRVELYQQKKGLFAFALRSMKSFAPARNSSSTVSMRFLLSGPVS